MKTISSDEMQRDFSVYLRQVSEGETLLIVEGDTPVAEIKPVAPKHTKLRPFGLCAGQFTVPVDFDAPLSEEILRDFEGR